MNVLLAEMSWPEAFTAVGVVFGFAAMFWALNR